MTRRTTGFVLVFALAVGGCCARRLGALDGQLRAQAGAGPAADARLVALASDARRGAGDCPALAPSFYRVAAVAAWQAGDGGATLVGPIAAEGEAACAALPAAKRPVRDCTLIRVAAPMAAQDALTRRQATIRQRLDAAPTHTLPAADRGELLGVVRGYRAPFDELTAIRSGLGGPEVPAGLAAEVDRRRLEVCCNASAAWSLLGDVEGATMRELASARGTVDACEAALRAGGVAVVGPDTCRPAAARAAP